MTTLTAPRSSAQQWQYEVPVIGGIVVGFDGSPASHAALESAALIAAAKKCPVHVVSVLPPMSSYHMRVGIDEGRSALEDSRIQLCDAAIRAAIGSFNDRDEWTRQVTVGRTAEEIALAADARCADLIILGRSECGVVDRLRGGETTLQVMRSSSVPVLVVAQEMNKPDTVVVAVDFGPASVRAASIGMEMLGESGTLYLVHVEEPVDGFADGVIAFVADTYPGRLLVLFRRLIEDLRVPPGVVVESVMLNGRPTVAITEFCERVGADLLAAGMHGLNGVERFLMGSVSTGLVRKACQPILVAPARD
jgi:nucleotide-binding universal stress UspA family protein